MDRDTLGIAGGLVVNGRRRDQVELLRPTIGTSMFTSKQ